MVVTGTAGWAYSVDGGHVVTSKATVDGVAVWANDAARSVSCSAAPGSGSRIDIIYAQHQDVDDGDADSVPIIDVAEGTASGSPSPPSLPTGATELARATVSAGNANTNAAAFSTAYAKYTAARGAPIPVPTSTERDAITWGTLANPARVLRRDLGVIQVNDGTGWLTEGALPSRKRTYSGTTSVGSSSSTTTVIPFNADEWNAGIAYGGAEDFTAPCDGRYHVILSATIVANGAGNRWLVRIVDGTTATIMCLLPGTASNSTILNASAEFNLTAGQTVRFGVRQTSGVSLNLTGASVVVRCAERT